MHGRFVQQPANIMAPTALFLLLFAVTIYQATPQRFPPPGAPQGFPPPGMPGAQQEFPPPGMPGQSDSSFIWKSSSTGGGAPGSMQFPDSMPPEIRKQFEAHMQANGQFGANGMPPSPGPGGKSHRTQTGGFRGPQPAPGQFQSSTQYEIKGAHGGVPQQLPPNGGFSHQFTAYGAGHAPPPNAPLPETRQVQQTIQGGGYIPPMYGPHPEHYYQQTHTIHGGYAPPMYGPLQGASYHHVQTMIPGFYSHGHYGYGAHKAAYGGYPVQGYGHSVPYVYGHTHHIIHAAPHPPPPVMAVTHHHVHHYHGPPQRQQQMGYGFSASYQGQYGYQQPPPSLGIPNYQAQGRGAYQQQPQPGFAPPPPSQHFVPNKPTGHTPGQIKTQGTTYYAPAHAPPGTGHPRPHRKNTRIVERPKGAHGPSHFHNFQGPHRPKGSSPTHFYEKHRK